MRAAPCGTLSNWQNVGFWHRAARAYLLEQCSSTGISFNVGCQKCLAWSSCSTVGKAILSPVDLYRTRALVNCGVVVIIQMATARPDVARDGHGHTSGAVQATGAQRGPQRALATKVTSRATCAVISERREDKHAVVSACVGRFRPQSLPASSSRAPAVDA